MGYMIGGLVLLLVIYFLDHLFDAKADQARRNQTAEFMDRAQAIENESFWKGTPWKRTHS